MKSLIKKIIGSTGYTFIKSDYLSHFIHINETEIIGVYLLLGRKYSKESNLTFFDIGANIGQTTLRIKQFFPNSVVYVFEPINKTFSALKKNVSSKKNVHLFNKAMGNQEGTIEVFHRQDSEWNSLVPTLNKLAEGEGGLRETITVTTIDEFVKENSIHKIHLLKTDTEGFEMEVLEGAKRSLENGLIEMIYAEVGFNDTDKQHVYWKRILAFLEPYGFQFLGFYDRALSENLLPYYANALFVKK